jgi:Tol biopolymer transport system component/lysophospholipase L1-like esterase
MDTHSSLSKLKQPLAYRVILGFATLFVANPLVVFLVTERILPTVALPMSAIILLQYTFSRPSLKLFTVYLFNTFLVISFFAHAEVVLTSAYPEYVFKDLYTIEDGYTFNRPFLSETFTAKEFSTTYRTNAQGLRISEGHDPSRTTDRADWLVLGDSFTQGAQVEFEDLFTSRLNERFPDKIVINAGSSGLGIGHEYNYFIDDGHHFNPSLVILQLSSFNDFYNVEPQQIGFTDRLMTYSAFIRYLLVNLRFPSTDELPLGRWTEPFYLDQEFNTNYNIFYNSSSAFKDADIVAFRNYVELFHEAVTARGAELLIVLIPTKEQVEARYFDEVIEAFAIDPAQLDMRRPNNLLRELANQHDFKLVDLLPAFQAADDTMFFEYDEHLSLSGHRVVADTIAQFISSAYGDSSSRLLSRVLGGDRYPSMSIDGTLISYQSFRDGNTELYIADPVLDNARRLTLNDVDDTHPMLSRDASRILFTEGDADLFRTEVVLMDLDGSNKQQITTGDFEFGAIPTFSPSNAQVAYAGWHYDETRDIYSTPQIVVRDLSSGHDRAITDGRTATWRPVFSPDGTALVYISSVDDQYDLFTYDLITEQEHRLTDTTFDEWDPYFSPDGSHVVYAGHADDNWDLFLYDLEHGTTIRLTESKGNEWDPNITPDGTSILFAGVFGLIEAIYSMPYPR